MLSSLVTTRWAAIAALLLSAKEYCDLPTGCEVRWGLPKASSMRHLGLRKVTLTGDTTWPVESCGTVRSTQKITP